MNSVSSVVCILLHTVGGGTDSALIRPLTYRACPADATAERMDIEDEVQQQLEDLGYRT